MSIENTTQRDPLVHVVGAMGSGTDRYILGMEADGQRQIVNSSLLPTDAPWDELTALGFVKGDPVAGDDLFVNCTLPEGWSRAGTGHSMHSEVLDERGVPRVGVFYKAAFYDRRASAHVKHVGRTVAMAAQYGDDPAGIVPHLDVLTDGERAEAVEALRYALGDCDRRPDDSEERGRIKAALVTLGEPDATPLVRDRGY